MDLVVLEQITKSFGKRIVLEDCSLTIKEGEFLMIHGPSGVGKSTLLSIIGLLDAPDSGQTQHFSKKNVRPYSSNSRKLLSKNIGWLFQNYALADERTVQDNLALFLPWLMPAKKKKQQMEEALASVGLSGMLHRKVSTLSGGEQQRVAMARILLRDSSLILADEPTGNLDEDNAKLIMNVLADLHKQGKTVVAVSHDSRFDDLASRTLILKSPQAHEEA